MRRNQRQTATVPPISVTLPENPLPIKTTHKMPPWKNCAHFKLSVSDSKILVYTPFKRVSGNM